MTDAESALLQELRVQVARIETTLFEREKALILERTAMKETLDALTSKIETVFTLNRRQYLVASGAMSSLGAAIGTAVGVFGHILGWW